MVSGFENHHLHEGPEGSFDEEEEVSQSSRGRRRPREGEGEEEEERSQSRDDVTVEQYLTHWDPVLQRLRPYRILNSGNDAESGEEFFVLSPTHGYQKEMRRPEQQTWKWMRATEPTVMCL